MISRTNKFTLMAFLALILGLQLLLLVAAQRRTTTTLPRMMMIPLLTTTTRQVRDGGTVYIRNNV